MTLKETIKYHKTVAEELGQEAEQIRDEDYIHAKYYRKCAHEHEQLAHWLEELVELRSQRSSEFEWCKGCKEHDEENHCCRRLSNFIHTQAQEIHDMAYEEGKNDRPQGEWKLDSLGAYCSECGTHPDYSSNFCPNCGADMMKGGDEE